MEKQEIFNKLDRIAVLVERVKAFNLLQEDYLNFSNLESDITLKIYGGGYKRKRFYKPLINLKRIKEDTNTTYIIKLYNRRLFKRNRYAKHRINATTKVNVLKGGVI